MFRFLRSIQRLSLFSTTTTAATTTTVRSFSKYTKLRTKLRVVPQGLQLVPQELQSHLIFRQPDPRSPDSTSALVGDRLKLHDKVQSLIGSGSLDSATTTVRDVIASKRSLRPTVFTCNAVMAAMFNAHRYDDVVNLFQFFFEESNINPNIVSYNTLIKTHCYAGRVDVALDVYRSHFLAADALFSPSLVTYKNLIEGLFSSNRISEAVDLLHEMPKYYKGEGDKPGDGYSLVYNELISRFLQLGKLDKALELLQELRELCPVYYDGVVHATFMDWYFRNGREKDAMESYQTLLDCQFAMKPATCNVLMEVLLRYDKCLEVSILIENMLNSHKPSWSYDGTVHATFMDWCFKNGREKDAMESYQTLMDCQIAMKPITCNALLEVLLKYGKSLEASNLFDNMLDSHNPRWSNAVNSDSYNIMVNECFKLGKISEAMVVFRKTGTKQGSEPYKKDAACYGNIVEKLCEHGLVSDAEKLLEEMRISPSTLNFTTYKSFIEVYLKIDRVDDAIEMFKEVLLENRFIPSKAFCAKVFDELIKKGKLNEISDVLEKMGRRKIKLDTTSYEIVITGLSKAGRLDRVRDLMDQMEKRKL